MKRLLAAAALLALCAAPAAADYGYLWYNIAVSDLPAACYDGQIMVITDGATTDDCTVGGLSNVVACMCVSNAWVPVPDISGSGLTNYFALWSDSDTLSYGAMSQSGSTVNVAGSVTLSGTVDGVDIAAHAANADAHIDHADSLAELNTQIGASLADGPHTTDTTLTAPAANYIPKSDGSDLAASVMYESASKIGIGTTSPAYPLVVSDAGTEGIEFDPAGCGNGAGIVCMLAYDRTGADYEDLYIYYEDVSFSGESSDSSVAINAAPSSGVELYVYNNTANADLKIKTGGAGTDASLFLDAATSDDAAIYFMDAGTYNWLLYQVATSQNFNLYDYTYGGTVMQWAPNGDATFSPADDVILNPVGKVGVKDTTPDEELSVRGQMEAGPDLYSLTLGYGSGDSMTGSNQENVTAGYLAGTSITSGTHTTAVGSQAMGGATVTGLYNTAIGRAAGYLLAAGWGNVGVGYGAGYSLGGDSYTVAIGMEAASLATTSYTVAIGINAGQDLTADYNTYVGSYSGFNVTSGERNAALGYGAGGESSTATGSYNTSIGMRAGYAYTSGYGNALLGYVAGYALTTGYYNTLLGYAAGDNLTTGYGNIIIGDNLDATAAGSNDTLNIGNLIEGDLSGKTVDIDGRVEADGVSETDANLEPEYCAHFSDADGFNESDDNTPVVTLPYAYTVTRMACHITSYAGSAGNLAFEDNNGNALTHTAVVCQQGVTEAVFQNCTGGCAMAANETLQFDVTNGSSSINAYPIVTACYTVD